MSQYWLLTIRNQFQRKRRINAKEIFNIRTANNFWVVNENNPNFHRIKEGDKAVFYQGGASGKHFLGRCAISSHPQTLTQDLKKLITTQPSLSFNHFILLRDIEVWEKPKPIIPLLDKLSFVHNKNYWGSHLQGGLRSIPEHDYYAIISFNVS